MMISSKIKKLIEQSRIQQKEVAEYIGMTPNGLRNALDLDDFRVSALEKFAELFKVPMSYWFSDEPSNFFLNNEGNILANSTVKGRDNLNINSASAELSKCQNENESLRKEVEMLRELLAAKDETIQALKGR